MVNCVPDEIIPARLFEDSPEQEPEQIPDVSGTKMPPELATPPELKRGQILWIRGLTRLQTQVSNSKSPLSLFLRAPFWILELVFRPFDRAALLARWCLQSDADRLIREN